MVDNDGNNNNRIKIPDATDNGTFGLVNTDNDYPDSRVECQTPKCRTLTIYNNNNKNKNSNHNSKNNVDNNSNSNDHDSSLHDNRTFGLVNNTNNDYLDNGVEYWTLTSY